MTNVQRALLSIDLEDWFQVENLKGAISRDSWAHRELRVAKNVDLILEILDQNKTRATFFVLGWIAEHVPAVVKRIHAQGHEIASHGYGHELVYSLTPEQFRQDVRASKRILEDLTGAELVGYRAPSFSITDWAIGVLIDQGFKYDSSLFPSMAHDRYGKLREYSIKGERNVELEKGFREIVLSCLPVFGRNIPWAGGGYFRIIPFPVFRSGVKKILREKGSYCFYIHPWEFDPDQPRIRSVKSLYQFRHYKNLDKTKERFVRLLKEFDFVPLREALPPESSPRRGQ
jgi:polysaccharide deacetylase family protein (PEP-CTERM system associated)